MEKRGASGDHSSGTLAYGDRPRRAAGIDETLPAPAAAAPVDAVSASASNVRSTVLPRMERREGAPRVVLEGRPRYQELSALGAGGQAEVTLTRDHDIDRAVAVKRLLPERTDEASLLRFVEEIRVVGQLEHPNIVPIHDVGVDEHGRYFFVMKYVEGETLESIIEKLRAGDEAYARRYTIEQRLQICMEVLRGVQHAHELGIVHRDLKPGNVMIGSLGEVVIMDWGLAKRLDGAPLPAASGDGGAPAGDERARLFATHAGALLGTPSYMAPEQAAGRLDEVDARSDVYSLAVMFYELLCLEHPRRHCATVAEMIASVIDEPISKTRVILDFGRVGAPPALAHFVRHGLDPDPARRYPSVAAMRERLEAVRDGKAPVECVVTFTQRGLRGLSRGVDRHPYVVLASAALIGLGGLAGAAVLVASLLR